MTAEEHIIAWIESSAPHYSRLLTLALPGKLPSSWQRARYAANLVSDAYYQMITSGDALRDGPYSPAELLRAAIELCDWKAL